MSHSRKRSKAAIRKAAKGIDLSDLLAKSLDDLFAERKVLAAKKQSVTAEVRVIMVEYDRLTAAIQAKKTGDNDAFGVSDHAVLRYLERIEGMDISAIRKRIREYAKSKMTAGIADQVIGIGSGAMAPISGSSSVMTVWTEPSTEPRHSRRHSKDAAAGGM
jgi:hypothetical protein